MQMITSRQSRLLEFLLSKKEYVAPLEAAEYLSVPEKTVQHDLHLLEPWLSKREIIIDKRAGAGVILSTDNITSLLYMDQLLGSEGDDIDGMTDSSRRVKIASQLLSEIPHGASVNKLSKHHFISSTSIANDLKVVESWITPLGLSLIRSQSGMRIEDSGSGVRQAMVSLINGMTNHNEPDNVIYSRLDPGSYKALVHYLGEEDALFVQILLQGMGNDLCWSLGKPYYVNIFVHIPIVMCRIARGNALPGREENISTYDKSIFSIASRMIQHIEKRIAHPLSEDGVWSMHQYIISSGTVVGEHSDVSMTGHVHSSDEVCLITHRLVITFAEMINSGFSQDTALYDGLLIHIRPLINRSNYQIRIRNPLLEDIKGESQDMWRLTQCAVNRAFNGQGEWTVSEDEVGYLTAHFQTTMEYQIARKYVLLICSTGIGTSHLFRSRIPHAFPS